MLLNPTNRNEALLASISALRDRLKREGNVAELFPWENWSAIAETGLFAELVREDLGGPVGVKATVSALERLGEINEDQGLSFSVATHLASTIYAVAKYGSEDLRQRILRDLTAGKLIGAHAISEDGAGSDALSMQTRAAADGDTYVLTGDKAFVTNGPIADVIVVYAKTGQGNTVGDVSAFLVPTNLAGIERGAPMAKSGLHNSPLSSLHLRECRIPASNLLGRQGGGFAILSNVMKREILFAFMINVGEMRRRLDRCVRYANQRQQFSTNIGSFQSVSNRIAEMKIRYELSQKWLYHVTSKLATNHDITTDIAIAKVFVSEAAIATAIDAMHIHGGHGFLADSGFGDEIASAVAGPIYSGTNDIQRGRIAAMLGVTQ